MAIDQITNNRINKLETTVYGQIKDYDVNFASTVNVILPANASTIIDGQTLTNNGITFLLTNQTNKAENGIYAVLSVNPFTFGRITTFQSYEQISNSRIQIRNGTKAGNFYLVDTTLPFILNTTLIVVEDADPVQESFTEKFNYLNNLNNIYTICIDFNGGNDTTGTGSKNKPFKTLSKAVSICTDLSQEYVIIAENGIYAESTPSITIPGNINIVGNGRATFGAFTINVNYNGINKSEVQYKNLNAIFSLNLEGSPIAENYLPSFHDGNYNVTRTDTNTVNRFIKIYNSQVSNLDVTSYVATNGCIFTGSCNVRNNGVLIIESGEMGVNIQAEPQAIIELIAVKTSNILGAITGSIDGLNNTIKTIVRGDATALKDFQYKIINCKTEYIDDASNIGYTPNDVNEFNTPPLTVKIAIDDISYRANNIDCGTF